MCSPWELPSFGRTLCDSLAVRWAGARVWMFAKGNLHSVFIDLTDGWPYQLTVTNMVERGAERGHRMRRVTPKPVPQSHPGSYKEWLTVLWRLSCIHRRWGHMVHRWKWMCVPSCSCSGQWNTFLLFWVKGEIYWWCFLNISKLVHADIGPDEGSWRTPQLSAKVFP